MNNFKASLISRNVILLSTIGYFLSRSNVLFLIRLGHGSEALEKKNPEAPGRNGVFSVAIILLPLLKVSYGAYANWLQPLMWSKCPGP